MLIWLVGQLHNNRWLGGLTHYVVTPNLKLSRAVTIKDIYKVSTNRAVENVAICFTVTTNLEQKCDLLCFFVNKPLVSSILECYSETIKPFFIIFYCFKAVENGQNALSNRDLDMLWLTTTYCILEYAPLFIYELLCYLILLTWLNENIEF